MHLSGTRCTGIRSIPLSSLQHTHLVGLDDIVHFTRLDNLKPRPRRTRLLPNEIVYKQQNRDKFPQQNHAVHRHMHSICPCVCDGSLDNVDPGM